MSVVINYSKINSVKLLAYPLAFRRTPAHNAQTFAAAKLIYGDVCRNAPLTELKTDEVRVCENGPAIFRRCLLYTSPSPRDS